MDILQATTWSDDVGAVIGWLDERLPASGKAGAHEPLVGVRTFVEDDEYLGMKGQVWPGVLEDLEAMCAPGIHGAIIEQGIGGGKSYRVAIKLLYDLYCLAYQEVVLARNPRLQWGLDPDTMISFANVSRDAKNSKRVVFGYISSFIDGSPWFQRHLPRDPSIKSELRFELPYSIFPGHSHQSSVIGLNLYSCVIDEANFFVKAESSGSSGTDYVTEMYDAIESRIRSRFGLDGFLGVISSRRTVNDFTSLKRSAIEQDPLTARHHYLPTPRPAWEDWPLAKKEKWQWRRFNENRLCFEGDPVDHTATLEAPHLWVPQTLWGPFATNPESSLRDHASIPSEAVCPYMRRRDRIVPDWEMESPIRPGVSPEDWADPGVRFDELVHDWFVGDPRQRYHFHVDLALGTRDAAGLCVAVNTGVDQVALSNGERRPEKCSLIDIELAIQLKAAPGREVEFARIRELLYWLKEERGFAFRKSSYDGWQSIDSIQILSRKGFQVEHLSVDRNLEAYDTAKDALYEGRVFFPPAVGQTPESSAVELINMAQTGDPSAVLQVELRQLELVNGKKVDHPASGSKDVADAFAGAVTQASRFIGAAAIMGEA